MSEPAQTIQRYDVGVHDGLTFSNVNRRRLLADLYLPRGAPGPLPVVIWLHGGGWRIGDRKLCPDLRSYFAQEGFAMVSIDYRLSGEATFPAAAVDVACAVRWVRSIASQYGLDTARIALWGSSAGAHLGALVAMAPADTFASDEHDGWSSEVHSVVDGYGPTDFLQQDAHRHEAGERSDDPESVQLPPGVRSIDPNSFESLFLGAPIGERPNLVRQANPITYVRSGLPPFLIMHGLSDHAVPAHQSELLYEALAQTGNDATLVMIEKLGHGFFNRNDFGAKAYRTKVRSTRDAAAYASDPPGFSMVLRFLRSRLGPR